LKEGYFYLTASHRRKPDLIEEYPRLLLDRCVEGFILIDTVLEHSLKLPVVAVARAHRKIEGVTNVVLDQRRAAELLRHLHQLGTAESPSCAAAATVPMPTIAGSARWRWPGS
jgi:DNA-binding LacI/PurR family transcriptional regulator